MQAIYNIAEICSRKNVLNFILSPGSRCAPLTISLVRHPKIQTRTIPDERSAAFIAIGVAQQTKQTCGLVCTSGSAVYNYAPAVAEAFYQQIPLLILTADRPPEWIDQFDGQTIRQNEIFGKHVKASFTFPADTTHTDSKWEATRIISEAINLTQEYPKGPVHVNIPLREPLYPLGEITFDNDIKIIEQSRSGPILWNEEWNILEKEFQESNNVLIISGQQDYDKQTEMILTLIQERNHIPVIADHIANLPDKNIIHHQDIILASDQKQLKPDLVITFGKSIISKSLKLFLRKNKATYHWHIQESGKAPDTFQSLTRVIHANSSYFFIHLLDQQWKKEKAYFDLWFNENNRAKKKAEVFFNDEKVFTEFHAVKKVMESLPKESILHLSNSMPVRYANYFTSLLPEHVEVFANRGTSGIDGVISTAVGHALSTKKIVTVIVGDMAFLYDRNAWWNNYIPNNLRIIVLNNHGGGIFRILDGPASQPELDEYFETRQKYNAEHTANEFNLKYALCKSAEELERELGLFFKKFETSKILEVETDSKTNTDFFKKFKKTVCN